MSHLVATAAVIGVLIVVNLLANKWAKEHYMLICFVATGVLLGIARLDGLDWSDLGLAQDTWRNGLYWSIGVFAAVAAFYGIASALPVTRRGFNDKRAAEQGWLSVLYNSTIRIPFGTALLEETAFRAVLLAVVADGWGLVAGIVVSSVLFGFWHVLPSLDFHENHEAAGKLGTGLKAQLTSVALTVLGTGAAGVGFCLLREYTDSLFPPIVLHASLNGIGLAVSWAFARRLRDL
jgi:membrane protease YdiL (CAAX protease family)